MPDYVFVHTAEEYRIAENLFRQYAGWLGIDLAFQHFSEELSDLTAVYGPPKGAIILCKDDDSFVGCVAIRQKEEGIAELKRMYVIPTHQRKGIGASLLEEAICFARESGHKKIRLDTLDHMTAAITLYSKLGFYEIPPYYFNPEKNAVYFEKVLT